MHALDILGDPVRRRILELLVNGEQTSGAVVDVVNREFGISQPAVSQHLKVLREAGFATVRADGQRRLYAINSRPLEEAAHPRSPARGSIPAGAPSTATARSIRSTGRSSRAWIASTARSARSTSRGSVRS
jgi:DNA-binding transcriptional ArsR family regulator